MGCCLVWSGWVRVDGRFGSGRLVPVDTVSQSRGALRPRFAKISLTLQSEGAGNAGRPMRPIAACAMIVGECTRAGQVTPVSPGIPRAMVLTVSFVLSLVSRALLPPSPAQRASVVAVLIPASGDQDHTTSPSERLPLVSWQFRVHRIPPLRS